MAASDRPIGGRLTKAFTKPATINTTFPILSFEEIVVALKEANIHTDEESLPKCRIDAIKDVYDQLLYICLGMTKDDLYLPKLSGLDAINYEDMHEESIPVMHFIRSM